MITSRNEGYVYLIKCKDDSIYTGYTRNIRQRIEAHFQGIGARWTRAHGCLKFIFFWYPDFHEAYRMEKKIKKYSRQIKLELFENSRNYLSPKDLIGDLPS